MRKLSAAVAAFALVAGQALAAGSPPLSPGNPAGVAKAQDADQNILLYALGGAAVIAGIALLASSSSNKAVSGSTTTTSPVTTTSTST